MSIARLLCRWYPLNPPKVVPFYPAPNISIGKLSQVEFRADRWHSEPPARRQTCVDQVDLDIDDEPGGEPQWGQRGSCRSK